MPKESENNIIWQTQETTTHYLGATDPCLHSDSKEGRTAGFRTAVRMIFRAIKQLFSCISGNAEDRSPKAILLLDAAMAGSRKGSSISTRNRILNLTSYKNIKNISIICHLDFFFSSFCLPLRQIKSTISD